MTVLHTLLYYSKAQRIYVQLCVRLRVFTVLSLCYYLSTHRLCVQVFFLFSSRFSVMHKSLRRFLCIFEKK